MTLKKFQSIIIILSVTLIFAQFGTLMLPYVKMEVVRSTMSGRQLKVVADVWPVFAADTAPPPPSASL